MNLWWTLSRVASIIPLKVGDRLRKLAYKRLGMEMGMNSGVEEWCYISDPSKVELGNNVVISKGTILLSEGGIKVKDNVLFAPYVNLLTCHHNFRDKNKIIKEQGTTNGKIEICEDVWLGMGCVIMGKVKIGKGAVIGANSIIKKDVPEYSIVVGKDRIIGKRGNKT